MYFRHDSIQDSPRKDRFSSLEGLWGHSSTVWQAEARLRSARHENLVSSLRSQILPSWTRRSWSWLAIQRCCEQLGSQAKDQGSLALQSQTTPRRKIITCSRGFVDVLTNLFFFYRNSASRQHRRSQRESPSRMLSSKSTDSLHLKTQERYKQKFCI